jgi:hypothetical protein
VHEDDGKVVALVIVVPRLRDPEGADALCEALLRWPEDRQKVKEQLATARAADEGCGGAGGKSAGKLDPATLPASVAAPTAFEANVPQGYNAPTALTELAATQPIATTSTADATATDAVPAPEPAPTLEPEPGPTAAVAATEEAGPEPVAATATAENARVEAQAGGAEFSLNVLQSSCPPGVDPKHKEKSLGACTALMWGTVCHQSDLCDSLLYNIILYIATCMGYSFARVNCVPP